MYSNSDTICAIFSLYANTVGFKSKQQDLFGPHTEVIKFKVNIGINSRCFIYVIGNDITRVQALAGCEVTCPEILLTH